MIDVSCFVGAGPLGSVDPAGLESMLRRAGFSRAAVSPMAGLFRSASSVNSVELPDFFRLVPVVDPRWPDLATLLAGYRRAGCPAVRICPGSHGYSAAGSVKALCGSLGLVLMLQMRIADPRNLPAGLELGEVPDAVALARAEPSVPMVVAGARVGELPSILGLPSVYAELSLAEEPDVLRRAVAAYGADRLLVGTHAPFLTSEAARAKVTAARLSAADLEAVTRGNAAGLGF
jgi:hypothetical protein